MTINPEFLIVFGAGTAALCILALLRTYKESVPIHWLFFLTFLLGALGISFFYYEIAYGLIGGLISLATMSRVLWAFILLTTSLLAISILVYRR